MICYNDDYLKFTSAMSLGGTSKDGYTLLKRENVDLMRKNHLAKDIERTFPRRTIVYSHGLARVFVKSEGKAEIKAELQTNS